MPADSKADVDALRELAANRGFRLVRSRVRTPGRKDFGKLGLVDAVSGEACLGIGKRGLTATPEDVAAFLRDRAGGTWKRSLGAVSAAKAKPAPAPSSPKAKAERAAARKRPASKPPATPKRPPRPDVAEDAKAAEPVAKLVRIRRASGRDASAIRKLFASINGSSPPRNLSSAIQRAARQGSPVLVAHGGDGGEVVGVVASAIIHAPHRAKPIGRIASIVVDKAARRRGIGAMLLNAAEKALRAKGCEVIEAAGDMDFSGAGAFFRACGYGRSSYRFTKA